MSSTSVLNVIPLTTPTVFFKADAEYGTRVAEGIGLEVARVKDLDLMSQE